MTTTLPAKTSRSASPAVTWRNPTTINATTLAWALVLGLAYAAGSLLVYNYLDRDAVGVVFFPAAGLGVAAMMLTRPRVWPLWIVAIAIPEVVIDMSRGDRFLIALGFGLANTLEPVVGATLVRIDTKRGSSASHSMVPKTLECFREAGTRVLVCSRLMTWLKLLLTFTTSPTSAPT